MFICGNVHRIFIVLGSIESYSTIRTKKKKKKDVEISPLSAASVPAARLAPVETRNGEKKPLRKTEKNEKYKEAGKPPLPPQENCKDDEKKKRAEEEKCSNFFSRLFFFFFPNLPRLANKNSTKQC